MSDTTITAEMIHTVLMDWKPVPGAGYWPLAKKIAELYAPPAMSDYDERLKAARDYNQKHGLCGYPCFAKKPCMWCVKLADLLRRVQLEEAEWWQLNDHDPIYLNDPNHHCPGCDRLAALQRKEGGQ